MPRPTRLSIAALTEIVTGIFLRAGLNDIQARSVAATIVAGERDNCKSHGIYRIAGCLRTIEAGKVDPAAEPELQHDGGPLIRVNAGGGFSTAAFSVGAPVLAEQAAAQGIAALVINDCTHFSALWPEIETLTEAGVAALAMCPSYAAVAPSGGTAPLLGTNPFAFGWPRPGRHPYVFDFATSIVARGEIELHRQDGRTLPEGWAVDAEGRPTTDPHAALAGAMLPFGGHKGSAISTMIELLAGAMIGDLTSPEALGALGSTALLPAHGELIIAMSPARFAAGRPGDPFARAERLLDAIAGQGARLPSERRFAARAAAMRDGIALSAEEMAMLEELRAG
ncbi:Malate/lactate/ureidoglycolate dehydrogenase, LDH2 family [Paracoccus isoporae]|uniref:Malate/lactate/ureidoglycolate dehydrogenase, LDH2 family n=1 Tax=Paracoccus isoporae TaxID=591205 RepID=A0A1G7DGQ0_9RHOB|nr:Ldh family oxidoreductase [Paracoccus isoporae]SDE49995.1 Malate/lactate/ureidoglycolate dehydrogenase, LDH2 family [Paracoccus isoporae]